jgi:hypothetical protein
MKEAILNVLGIVLLGIVQLLEQPLRLVRNADRDKLQHHIVGAWVCGIGAVLALLLGLGPLAAGIAALTAALAVGLVKELADWLENRAAVQLGRVPTAGVERQDFTATWSGAVPVAAPLILLGLLA